MKFHSNYQFCQAIVLQATVAIVHRLLSYNSEIYYHMCRISAFIFHASQILNVCFYSTIFQDRDDIMRQLTCTISNEDFDDKSTRQPTQSSNIESSQDVSPNLKTTKPWIWTSNTIDTEYGTPTRHRRETEETMSPTSTKSTTETSTTPKPLIPTTKLRSAQTTSSFHDVTLESSVTEASSSRMENVSPIAETSTEIPSSNTENAEKKVTESEDAGEYPSAINQGQLFSIIENGEKCKI